MTNIDSRPYIAIIGDIKNSRNIPDRNNTQQNIIKILDNINKKYHYDICSKFMLTLGDEFQGLMLNATNILEIIEIISYDLYPIEIRYGIGIGDITTYINLDSPFGIDGPAYYSARKALDILKENSNKNREAKSNIRIEIKNNEIYSSLINSIFIQNTEIKSKWTPRQREIINIYFIEGKTQNNVAKKLNINQSSVNKALRNSGFYAYKQTQQSVTNTLIQLMENYNV